MQLIAKKCISVGCFMLAILLASSVWAMPAKVLGLRISTYANKSRLVFDLSSPVKYKKFFLDNPKRLVLDFKNAVLITKLNQPGLINTPIKEIRAAEHANKMLRLVLDLKQSVQIKLFMLGRNGMAKDRLVLDLVKVTPIVTQITSIKAQAPKVLKPIVSMAKQKKLRDIIVVIDPGHGGKDPGATGVRGTHEKNVVFAIGRELQAMINKQPGFKALLTRHGDYFLTLRQRLAIAQKDHADMFIAIHADAYKDHYARGASVFALSQRGATSEAARWLAQRENESELGHVLADKSNMLKSVLIDLAQTATISSSLQIGDDIIQQLAKVTKLHHDCVEQAAFVVLKSPNIPSLLVETGFLSNSQEEFKLRSVGYQHKIAAALMLGIKRYFIQHAPRGTILNKQS